MTLSQELLAQPPAVRWAWIGEQSKSDREAIFALCGRQLGTAHGLWVDDPVGWVERVLGEQLWSRQRAILASVVENRRTAVPACHAPGKTHGAARLVAWWSAVHPVGTAVTITTAPRWRQVRTQLWPHVGKIKDRAHLPGTVDQMQWKMPDHRRREQLVAWGFAAPDYDEDAFSGDHAPFLLLIVDEAGGISRTLGSSCESVLTGPDTRMLAIGNPPTDEQGGWFEGLCDDPTVNVLRLDADSTPNFTGEATGLCGSCPPFVAEHALGTHLVDHEWVNDRIREYGEDSRFVQARVYARFPKGDPSQAIPYSWLEDSRDAAELTEASGTWVRMGCDIASDGGDELAVSLSVGNKASIVHTSSGSGNASSVDVAGKILVEIEKAELLRLTLGEARPVRVKVDAIGLGWGVVSTLKAWGAEGRHSAEIIAVDVSERAKDPKKYHNKRAEMWWSLRMELQPSPGEDPGVLLAVDNRTLAQLSAPRFGHDTVGRVQIEKKSDIKKRTGGSPDRGESVLLARYEPVSAEPASFASAAGRSLPKVRPHR